MACIYQESNDNMVLIFFTFHIFSRFFNSENYNFALGFFPFVLVQHLQDLIYKHLFWFLVCPCDDWSQVTTIFAFSWFGFTLLWVFIWNVVIFALLFWYFFIYRFNNMSSFFANIFILNLIFPLISMIFYLI